MTPARLLLVRHPETDWNRENRWQGHADMPLNARGIEQMRSVWEDLLQEGWVGDHGSGRSGPGDPERTVTGSNVTAIYSSDLLRAHEMGTWLGVKLGLRPRILATLRERSMGEWEGKTPEEARAEWPELYPASESDPLRVRPPGGESFEDLYRRVLPILTRIAGLHPGETALVVTHGGILKVLLCQLMEIDLTLRDSLGMTNGASVLFEVEGTRWRVLKPDRLASRQSLYILDRELG